MKKEYKRIIGELLKVLVVDKDISEVDEKVILELIGDLKRILYI